MFSTGRPGCVMRREVQISCRQDLPSGLRGKSDVVWASVRASAGPNRR